MSGGLAMDFSYRYRLHCGPTWVWVLLHEESHGFSTTRKSMEIQVRRSSCQFGFLQRCWLHFKGLGHPPLILRPIPNGSAERIWASMKVSGSLVSNEGLRVCFVRVIFTKRHVPCLSLSGTYRDSSRFIEDWITGFADFTQPALAFADNGRRTARGLGRFSVTAFSIQESSRLHDFLLISSAPSFVPQICGERYISVSLQRLRKSVCVESWN